MLLVFQKLAADSQHANKLASWVLQISNHSYCAFFIGCILNYMNEDKIKMSFPERGCLLLPRRLCSQTDFCCFFVYMSIEINTEQFFLVIRL